MVFRRKLISYLEYMLMLTVVIECASVFTMTSNGSAAMVKLLQWLCVGLLVVCILLRGWKSHIYKEFDKSIYMMALIFIYTMLFSVYNTIGMKALGSVEAYALKFGPIFLFFILLCSIHRRQGDEYTLLYKYANIVTAYALISVVVYTISVANENVIPTDLFVPNWVSRTPSFRSNILNAVTIIPGVCWQMFGITWPRNYGVFEEPSFFAVALITALYVELFLRKTFRKREVFFGIILSLALLSAQSTMGLIIAVIGWGLKGFQILMHQKKKTLVFILIFLAAISVFALVEQKQRQYYETGDTGSNSTRGHIEDIVYSTRAFLEHPVLGSGLGNDDTYAELVRADRPEYELTGHSNSAFVVLYHGGIVLGLLFFTPYLLCLAQFRNKKHEEVAYFIVGPFLVFLFINTLYYLYLFFIPAFGYSLLDLRRDKESGKLRLSFMAEDILSAEKSDGKVSEDEANTSSLVKKSHFIERLYSCIPLFLGVLLIAGLWIFKARAWNYIYRVMKSHQLMLQQSPLMAFFLYAFIIFHCVFLGQIVRKRSELAKGLCLILWDCCYGALYPALYSYFETIGNLAGHRDSNTFFILLTVLYYFAILMAVALAENFGLGKDGNLHGRKVTLSVAAGAAALIIAAIGGKTYLHNYAYSHELPGEEALDWITVYANGPVFVNELPALYRQKNKDIEYTGTRGNGYTVIPECTVLCDQGDCFNDLFDYHFLLAEVDDNKIIYTCDSAVVDGLIERNIPVYRYYPYAMRQSLDWLARLNGRQVTEEMGVIIEGEGRDIQSGVEVLLAEGKYTVEFVLFSDDASIEEEEEVGICDLRVLLNRKSTIATYRVTNRMFREDGHAVVEIPFTLPAPSGYGPYVQFLVNGIDDHQVGVGIVQYRETPDYITLKTTNSHLKPIREEYYNLDSTPFVRAEGYSIVERSYDARDRQIGIRYFDMNGKPMITSNAYAGTTYAFNDKGSREWERYLDMDGTPLRLRAGNSALHYLFDAYGNIAARVYCDENNEPTILVDGYSEIRYTYNNLNKQISECYYDTNGNRVMLPSRYNKIEKEYDEAGNLILLRYMNTVDQPVLTSSGYSIIEREYDEKKHIIRESYYGTDGEPVITTGGYAYLTREYNAAGWISKESYFGLKDEPVLCNNGYAILNRGYDTIGNIISEWYNDTEGFPSACNSGYMEVRREYDSNRRNIRETYHAENGDRIFCTGGYSGTSREYDAVGNVLWQVYLDNEDVPILNTSGYASIGREFDDYKNVLEERYYDPYGNLRNGTNGYAIVRRIFNDRYQAVEETYFDKDGNRVINTSGISKIIRTYGERNQVLREEYYDTEDRRVLNTSGVSAVERSFNEFNQTVFEAFFDTEDHRVLNNAEYSGNLYAYDEIGNNTRVCRIGLDDQPAIETGNNYCYIEKTYNELRLLTKEEYFDADHQPVTANAGYSSFTREYTDRRQLALESYYDVDGARSTNNQGISSVRRSYDEFCNLREIDYYDTEDQPAELPSGYAVQLQRLDDARNVDSIRYMDSDGNTVLISDGYAEIRRAFDRDRRIVTEAYFDENGERMNVEAGYSYWTKSFDIDGTVIEQHYYDKDGTEVTVE